MMAQLRTGFLPLDRQQFGGSMGEAVAAIARQMYPRDTAKHIARAWEIDASTAANVVKGHCSERTLTKAVRAEGWSLITALGAAITGETFEQYEERRLNEIIQEAEHARQNIRRMAARRADVESRAAGAVALWDRSMDEPNGRKGRARRSADDRTGNQHAGGA